MSSIDWFVLIGTISFIVIYGVYKTRKFNTIKDHLKGGESANWLTVGLSVMATQASAITFLSTPGQAFDEGMGFVQFYFGLPLAIIVICMVFIPIYHKLKVYTAYEYLEQRFDRKTRTLASILFLVQRGLAAGITIFAPAIILSTILGWDLRILIFTIGTLVIIYTVSGGTKAVSITQKHQMFVIMSGMVIAFVIILNSLPDNINFNNALKLAGIGGKMEIVDFSFDIEKKYTFWSGITGGFFLALSYFGTDQSQVQRYLSGKSVKESQLGLMFNAVLKIPMQFFILLTGVMVFVFFQFNDTPINFNPQVTNYLEEVQNEDLNHTEDDQIDEPQETSPEDQINELNDKYLRLYSEFDNYRKRTSKERLELFKTAGQDILTDLLPVLDDFERAIQNMDSSDDSEVIQTGINLIYNKFKSILENKGLKHFKSIETEFDPEIHEAITKIPAPSKKLKGKVVDEIEKGYMLNDKVIRFAKVVVGE